MPQILYRQPSFQVNDTSFQVPNDKLNIIKIGDKTIPLKINKDGHLGDASIRDIKAALKKLPDKIEWIDFQSEFLSYIEDIKNEPEEEDVPIIEQLQNKTIVDSSDNLIGDMVELIEVEAPGLKMLSPILILSDLSTFTNNRCHVAIGGKPNQGKTWVLEKSNQMYPDDRVLELGSSDKAAWFKRKMLVEPNYFSYKISSFYDIGNGEEREKKEWIEIIKQMLSGDKLVFNMNIPDNEDVWKPVTIKGDRHGSVRMAMVEFFKEVQMQSRVLRLIIPSDEGYDKIVEDKQFSLPGLDIETDDRVDEIKAHLSYIMDAYEMLEQDGYEIYYYNNMARYVYDAIPTQHKFPNRDRGRAIGLLNAMTFSNIKNRQILYSRKHKRMFIIPTVKDIKTTVDIFTEALPYIADTKAVSSVLIKCLDDHSGMDVTRQDVIKSTNMAENDVIAELELLVDEGLLERDYPSETGQRIRYTIDHDFKKYYEQVRAKIKTTQINAMQVKHEIENTTNQIYEKIDDIEKFEGIENLINILGVELE